MGSGSWSTNTYRATTAAYSTKSREEIFHQRSLHEEMDLTKSKTHIRESRDSEEGNKRVILLLLNQGKLIYFLVLALVHL